MSKGLYIHYPFCASKCLYCDFYSVPDLRRREEYETALISAVSSFKERKFHVDTVFFGGGTPTLMTERGRERLFEAMRESFTLQKGCEITLEANPTSLKDPDVLESFFSLGVNRLSLGAQSFSDVELKALGRRHTAEEIEKTVESAVRAGFENISLDLMYRIPHQTKNSLLDNIKKAVCLPITHLSLYGLSIEEHSVFGSMAKQGKNLLLADDEEEREMYFEACDLLSENGFSHYEISNFAHRGFESRHNLKYWHAEEYIGIGAASHSYLKSTRYSSPRSISSFIENPLFRENEEIIDKTEKELERIMLGLRLREGVEIKSPTPEYLALEKELVSHGLATAHTNTLALTEKGFFISNSIISKVLDALEM